jgi:SAM-dependent methyltransferase
MNGTLYNFLTRSTERRIIGPLRRELLAQLHGEIAEVGAGTGANFPYYPNDTHVLALEPDSSMAKLARSRIPVSSAQIDLQLGNDLYLDALPQASLDAVVFTLVLCSVENPESTLHRARRVLKPDGMVILLEHVRSDGGVGRFQDSIAPLWRLVSGGCHLNRDTSAAATAVGFDTSVLRTQALGKMSPIQKILYGRLRRLDFTASQSSK